MPNIFSEKEWVESWHEAIKGDSRFKHLSIGNFFLICRTRRRPHPFNHFIEYPGQEIAYDIDMALDINAAGKYFKELKNISGWDIMDFRHMDNDSSFLIISESISNAGIIKVYRNDDKVWELDLSGDFQAYLASLNHSHKKKFLYYLNRFRKISGYKFYFAADNFDKHWDIFLQLHSERIAAKRDESLMQDKVYKDFYKNFCFRHFKGNTLKLACLEVGGKICAMLLGIEKYNTFYYLNSGFSSVLNKYSPGMVLPLLCIEYACAKGLKKFNFLGGDDKYKNDLGAKAHVTKRITLFRNRLVLISESIFEKIFFRKCAKT